MAAKLPNYSELVSAGINPKTGMPIRVSDPTQLKTGIKHFLRLVDEQDAINRYCWYNLPCDITGQELERLLYYKGQLAFFYMKDLDKFFFMPYALDGTIDFYGRFNTIHPVPMTSGEDEGGKRGAQAEILSKIKLDCKYGVVDDDDVNFDTMTKSCVLLHDYSKQLSQTIAPRQSVNDPLLDAMSECIPFMRTSLISGSGIKGIRVNDADQYKSVSDGSRSLLGAALNGDPWVPITGELDFQELTDGQLVKSQEYMLAMQSMDNLRLSGYGLDNGGLFEKKQHILESESAVNQSNVSLVLQDGLNIRQNFCNIVNSIWDLGIWCEISEDAAAGDLNGDGVSYDENQDGASSGMEDNSNDTSI